MNRLANLMTYVLYTNNLNGAICEFGVNRGGSLNFIRSCNTNVNRKIYGVDSFEGLPLSEDYEFHKKGEMRAEYEPVAKHFGQFENVTLYKGFSPGVFSNFPADIEFSFCHVDVDLYSSVTDACEFFWPRMEKDGVIIFDDYNWPKTTGATKAVHAFFDALDVQYKGELFWPYHKINGTKTTQFQYMVVK